MIIPPAPYAYEGEIESVTIPSIQDQVIIYNGSEQSPTYQNLNSTLVSVSGETNGINAGTYTVTFQLNNKRYYKWSDGTTDDKTATWDIGKANNIITVTPNSLSLTYYDRDGSFTVSYQGDGALTYTVDNDNVNISKTGNTFSVTGAKTGNSVISLNVAESTNYLTASATVNVSVDMARNFNITASIYPADSATVSGTGIVKEGNSITVTATPTNDYRFVAWKVNGETVSANSTYTFTPDSDVELVATCEAIPVYTITVVADPEDGSDLDIEYTAKEGTTQTINQTSNDGYRFVAWKVNGETVSTDSSYTFEVTSDITITAVYEEIPVYTISVIIEPEDYGTVSGTGEYREGSTCTLVSTNADGYTFSGWQEDGITLSTNETYSFTVTGDRTFTAVFEEFSRLPNGYTEVEYIESNNGAYIKTGVKPRASSGTANTTAPSDTKVLIDIEPLDNPNTANKYIVYSSGGISSTLYYYYIYWATTAGIYARIGSAGSSLISPVKNTTPRRMRLDLDGAGKLFKVDDSSSNLSFNLSPYNASTINLLGYATASGCIRAKLYSCKIYKEEDYILTRDFVPCINPDNEVGLYDLVEGKFYGNDGTGTLTAGPAI